MIGIWRLRFPLRATVVVLALVGVTACGSSKKDYPLVEPQRPPMQKPVTSPSGAVVQLPALPTRYAASPSPTCEREIATFHDGSQPTRRPVVIPPAPGLRARAVTEHTTRLEWSFSVLPDDCRPVQILLSVVAGRDTRATPTTVWVPIHSVAGSHEIAYAGFLPPPDVALASAFSQEGYRSRTVSILIRRPANTPADPPEPLPPVTAPAGEPGTCRGRTTVVDDPAGDVLTFAPGSPPRKVSKLTPDLAAIDIARASVQIEERTMCAMFVFARPLRAQDFQLTLSLQDTTSRSCCASLRFRQTAGRREVGCLRIDAHGAVQLDPVPNAGCGVPKLRSCLQKS